MPPEAEFALALAGMVAGGAFLLSPVMIVRQVLGHRERMAALRNRQEGAPGVVEEIQALRQEMATLRETTTRFDMSFDAALARVEDRLTRVEGETGQQRVADRQYNVAVEETETAVLRQR
jgi:hypothetical protein